MKLAFFMFALLCLNISFAAPTEGGIHTPNVCSSVNVKTCAHLMFEKYPNSSEESQFILHIMNASETGVQNVKVKLLMDMGNGQTHGSSPVKIETTDELNHFLVQNAWFVMTGHWQVAVSFTSEGSDVNLLIPLEIKE